MNKKTRKLFTWCLVVALIVTQMLFANVAFAATSLKGSDRYQTALEVVKAGWTTSENAVIARGDDLADALAAAPLAYAKGKAPILLTETAALPAGVLDELTALGVKNVYIVGGTGAVSAAVEAQLAAKFTVKRLWGADRAATALAVAKEAFPTAPAKAVLVNGYAVADALSISAIAAYNGMPILLAEKDSVAADVATYLAGKTVYAVGGTGVLSDAVVGTATRLSGADRYATNVAVLKAFTLDYSKVFVAVGEDANSVDALGGAAFAALGNNPIVLVNNALTAEASALLAGKVKGDTKVYTLGGVVPASVATAIEALMPKDLKVESVTIVNSRDLVIDFNNVVDEFTAVNKAYYEFKVNNSSTAIDAANFTLEVDANDSSKVNVTLAAGVALRNGDVVAVKVLKSVADELLKPMKADYTAVLPVFVDTTAPSIVKVATSGNDVVVTFDDYLAPLTDSDNVVKFNGTRILAANYVLNGKTLTLTGVNNPSLAAGNYVVTVSSAADFSGNVAGFLTKTLTVTNDFTVPAFSSIKAKSMYVFTVQFNKSLAAAPSVTVKKNGYILTVVSTVVDSTDSTKYNVTVADNGLVTVYNSGENTTTLEVSITGIKDTKNTIGSPVTTSVTLSKDTAAPTVISGNSAINGDNINIQFNEAISIVDADSIIVTDKDGIRLTGITASVEDDARYGAGTVLRLAKSELANGTYTINIGAGSVADTSVNANQVAAVTLTLTKTAASSSDITPVSVSAANNVITIDYNHEMTDSARTAANYKLDGASLPTGTILYFSGTKKIVVIELPAGSIAKTEDYVLTITDSVLTADGAKVAAAARNNIVSLVDNVKPLLVSAKKLTATTVELTFNEDMSAPPTTAPFNWNDDFVVKVNGVQINVTGVATGSDTTKLVLTVDAYNVDQTMTIVVGGTGITRNAADVQGNVIAATSTAITATK